MNDLATEDFTSLPQLQNTTKDIVSRLTNSIEVFVAKELETFEAKRVLPMVVLGVLLFFVPAITYVTLQTTASMFKVTHLVKLVIYRPGLFHLLKQPSTDNRTLGGLCDWFAVLGNLRKPRAVL